MEPCDVCLGTPLPSGRPCICDGIGTSEAEKIGLRKEVYRLEGINNQLLEALKDLVALYASTEGADPCFIRKGRAAIDRALGH